MTGRLLRLAAPALPRVLAAACVAVGAELASVALTGTAAWLISRAAQQPPIAALGLAIVGVRALALVRGPLRYADRLLGHDAVLAAVAGLRARVFAALVPLAPHGSSVFRGGDLLTRFVDDVDAVQDLLLRCLVPAAVAGAVGTAATAATAALLPSAGAVLAVGLLAAAAACAPLALAGRRGPRRAAARGAFADAAADLVRGAADLEVLGAADAAVRRAERAEREAARLELRADRAMGAASTAVLLLQGLTAVAVAWTALGARQDGGLDPVLAAVLAVTALAAFEPVAALPAAARRYGELSEGAARLAAVLDAPAPVAEPVGPGPEPRGSGVEVRGLRARYGPGRPWALDGLDLRLAPGTTTALAGASGSGKSTLVDVLLRFLDYEGGSVRLGGAELRDIPGDRVRRTVAGLTRHDRVLHASVRDNLLLARPQATDGELRRAALRVRLLAWIEALPQGWDTVLGEDGAAMSGGQRLRLLLARALLADPQVLVLDEPTEGLDAATAEAVLADVLRAARGRTVLLVSHHPAALAAADEVHSIAEGGARPAQV